MAPSPGRVNLYQRESLYALAWAPPDGAERRPSVAKNARATVRLYTTFSRLTNAPTEAFEERTFTLDVATTPTPDPTPPMVSGARPQLSIEDIWPGSDSLCHRAEIILRWTNPEQPPGTGAFASVTVTDAHPEGTTSNNRTGPEGAITRNYTAYAEQYCSPRPWSVAGSTTVAATQRRSVSTTPTSSPCWGTANCVTAPVTPVAMAPPLTTSRRRQGIRPEHRRGK